MAYIEKKPITRTKIRLFLGQTYYTFKKYLYWYFSRKLYSRNFQEDNLEYLIFKHSTPLFRKLKGVDMYLQYNKVENLKLAIKN